MFKIFTQTNNIGPDTYEPVSHVNKFLKIAEAADGACKFTVGFTDIYDTLACFSDEWVVPLGRCANALAEIARTEEQHVNTFQFGQFFKIVKRLWDHGALSDAMRLMPKKSPNEIRITFTNGLYDRVMEYDRTKGRERIQDLGEENIQDLIRKEFNVEAASIKLVGPKNKSCYRIPMDAMLTSCKIDFSPTAHDDEDEDE